MTNPGDVADPVATFPPTSVNLATNQYRQSGDGRLSSLRPDLDTVDFLVMTGHQALPTKTVLIISALCSSSRSWAQSGSGSITVIPALRSGEATDPSAEAQTDIQLPESIGRQLEQVSPPRGRGGYERS